MDLFIDDAVVLCCVPVVMTSPVHSTHHDAQPLICISGMGAYSSG